MPTNREADPVLVNLEVGCVRLGFSESEIEVRESPETKATFEETTTFNVQTKTRRCARHALRWDALDDEGTVLTHCSTACGIAASSRSMLNMFN